MKPTYEELERELRAYEATVKNLEARVAALAAENAALKSFGDKLNEMHERLNGEGVGIQGRAEVACEQIALEAAMDEFYAVETPATDAAIAELRAQGVEMFEQQMHADITNTDALEFAQQLRAEASK